MDSVLKFAQWALTHAKKAPSGASLALDAKKCCTDPWEYLYGTSGKKCTQSLLDAQYEKYYKGWGWSRSEYNKATAGWADRGVMVADCQGLLDAYCTLELDQKTDKNAQSCYADWCTDKGRIKDISGPYVIGEALFVYSSSKGKMTHVGWICGWDKDGEPLAVEERGLSYGCVITRVKSRDWTHRGLMTKRFAYDADESVSDKVVLKITSPLMRGSEIASLQVALNGMGYPCGRADGICGNDTLDGIRSFCKAHEGV
ncbi:hypothetical protein LJC42_00355 [Eubacteriales bacterium OttesenSCG-928-K08]|nr:hypothetical protein [Eubacteriales bacterium OttesenSCG-928-K08]